MAEPESGVTATPASERQRLLLARYQAAALDAHRSAEFLLRLDPLAREDPELADLLAALERSDVVASEGDFEAALKIFKSILHPLAEKALRKGMTQDEPALRAAALVARTLARAAFASCYLLGRDATKVATFGQATRRFADAEKLFSISAYDKAEATFRAVRESLGALARETEVAAAGRFAELAKRRTQLVDEIRRLPTRRFTQKQRENALAAIRLFDSAARSGDAAVARSALDDCRSFLDEQVRESTEIADKPKPPRSFFEDHPASERMQTPWGLVAMATAAITVIGVGFWRTNTERETATGIVGVSASGIAAPVVRNELGVVRLPPRVTAPAGSVAAPLRRSAPPPVAGTRAGGVEIRSSFPVGSSIRLVAGRRQRFAVELAAGDASALQWELDGAVVARGAGFVLDSASSSEPGTRTVALFAGRDAEPVMLGAWEVAIDSPIRFVALEPLEKTFYAAAGQPLAFRADATIEPTEPLSYRWTIDGALDESATKPELAFRPTELRDVTLRVEVTSASGAVVERVWNVSVAATPVEAASRNWATAYCAAFEGRAVDGLKALGDADADVALAGIEGRSELRAICKSSVHSDVKQGMVVRLERTLRWIDEHGKSHVQEMPTADWVLRRQQDRWVARAATQMAAADDVPPSPPKP